jgi:hypothetical protein
MVRLCVIRPKILGVKVQELVLYMYIINIKTSLHVDHDKR